MTTKLLKPPSVQLIPFKISARTAKLIGRENFSNAEGAVIELVKNSYDADAKHCIVVFSIKHERIPTNLTIKEFRSLAKTKNILKSCYKLKGRFYQLSSTIKQEAINSLQEIFFQDNAIYIIDNGHGMTRKVIDSHWMQIGTDNKEEEFRSEDGRIKTGAKGIGRFALDRLGFVSHMWTKPSKKNENSSSWKMDWHQFDIANVPLSEVKAEIDDYQFDLIYLLKKEFKQQPVLLKKFEKIPLYQGTVIKISSLKDNWHPSNLQSVYKSLESLVPPKELKIPFQVFFYSQSNLKEFGEIETAFFNDYDYKVEAKYDAVKLTVDLTITRNELDLKQLQSKYKHLFEKEKSPYDLKTILARKFQQTRAIFEIIKWERDTSNTSLLRNLGNFNFTFYYMKNTSQSDYPYRNINVGERQNVLRKFGGIKIYRDSFRVRPYGDVGNDWLKLGDRAAMSPAGAGQRIGDWRVGPNQIAGSVQISRIENPNLIDKSDRNALIENESFNILKKIITDLINYFEIDRSIILNRFYLKGKEEEKVIREKEIHAEAAKLADKLVEERLRLEREVYGSKIDLFTGEKAYRERDIFEKIIAEGLQNIEMPEEHEAEIAQVRTLASLGLIVSSFAHELKEVKNNIEDIGDLEKIFVKIAAEEKKKQQSYQDGIDIIEVLKKDNLRVAHWVDYSLTAIKKDKRKRTSLKFDSFFLGLKKQWDKVLSDRQITLEYKNHIASPYLFRAFEMDMSTIFGNLIANSIDAINNLKVLGTRKITISTRIVKNKIAIFYGDSGTGLPKIFKKDKDQIFLPFTTSKKDKDGNDIGTGLGMYLAKTVIDDNNGSINILEGSGGFSVKIEFPIRNSTNEIPDRLH
jgi:signal transduction histidine kinase